MKHLDTVYFYVLITSSVVLVWLLLFSNPKDKVIESKMVEVELLRVANHPPDFYVDIKDLNTGVEYKSVYVSSSFDDIDQLPYNHPFLVTRLKRLNKQTGNVRVEWRDMRSGLDWSKRFKQNIKN